LERSVLDGFLGSRLEPRESSVAVLGHVTRWHLNGMANCEAKLSAWLGHWIGPFETKKRDCRSSPEVVESEKV